MSLLRTVATSLMMVTVLTVTNVEAAGEKKLSVKGSAATTAWGTPTLTDWNGVWRRVNKPGSVDIMFLKVEPTPLYAPYLKVANEARDKGLETGHFARCLPAGMPMMASLVYPAEFIVRPHQINLLYEIGGDRRIRMNGTHPDYLEPTFRGDSIGHWEGDTLVIDTVALTTTTVIIGGARHSNRMRIIERMREVSPGIIENQLRVEDPLAFMKPIEYTVTYEQAKNESVMEVACEKNVEATEFKNTVDVFEMIPEPEQTVVHWAE